jgi:hypothetical protein
MAAIATMGVIAPMAAMAAQAALPVMATVLSSMGIRDYGN